MFGKDAASDKELQKMVNRRLQRSGSQAGVLATVQYGAVTITGKLRTEDQRLTIVRALRGVNGVRQVIDQLQSPPKRQPQQYPQTSPVSATTSPVLSDGDGAPLPTAVGEDDASRVSPIVVERLAVDSGDVPFVPNCL